MSLSKTLIRIIMGFSAAILFSTSAYAQSTILVVDTTRVLRESDVGKHIDRQMASIKTSVESELKAKASPLEAQQKSLKAQYGTQSPQVLQNDTSFKQKLTNFQKEGQKFQIEQRYVDAELKVTHQKAVSKVQERLRIILKDIVTERNADVVLERSLVIYGDPADVTDTVISRLNSQLKTVPVTRERLPRKS